MRKDNRKVLSPSGLLLICNARSTPILSFSGLTRESSQTNLPCLSLDPRVKPEGDSGGDESVPEGDRRKKVPEGDGKGKWRGAAAVAVVSVVFCLGAGEALAQCAVPPTCESLGYNKTAAQCGGTEILKCPFDTSKVFCNSNYVVNAKVGDIYYSDGTISTLVIPEKTPIGIVAYVEGNRGLMIALDESSEKWSSPGNSNLSCLPNLDGNGAEGDMNGKINTACILSEKSSGNTYPAAEYCNNYKPVSSGKGSSGWYLPAAGELKMIGKYNTTLNVSLQILSKNQLSPSSWYWSSSEYIHDNGNLAWKAGISTNDTMTYGYKNDYAYRVRCVLDF